MIDAAEHGVGVGEAEQGGVTGLRLVLVVSGAGVALWHTADLVPAGHQLGVAGGDHRDRPGWIKLRRCSLRGALGPGQHLVGGGARVPSRNEGVTLFGAALRRQADPVALVVGDLGKAEAAGEGGRAGDGLDAVEELLGFRALGHFRGRGFKQH